MVVVWGRQADGWHIGGGRRMAGTLVGHCRWPRCPQHRLTEDGRDVGVGHFDALELGDDQPLFVAGGRRFLGISARPLPFVDGHDRVVFGNVQNALVGVWAGRVAAGGAGCPTEGAARGSASEVRQPVPRARWVAADRAR